MNRRLKGKNELSKYNVEVNTGNTHYAQWVKKRYYIREVFERLVGGRSPAKAESATAGACDVLLKAVSRSRGDCK